MVIPLPCAEQLWVPSDKCAVVGALKGEKRGHGEQALAIDGAVKRGRSVGFVTGNATQLGEHRHLGREVVGGCQTTFDRSQRIQLGCSSPAQLS